MVRVPKLSHGGRNAEGDSQAAVERLNAQRRDIARREKLRSAKPPAQKRGQRDENVDIW